MKIALVVPGFSASERDWCIPALLQLVRELSARAEVHVFPLRYPHHTTTYAVHQATVHPQGGALVRGLGRMALIRRAARSIRTEHRRSPFDVVHAYWADEPGAVAVIAGKVLGLPVVVSLAGGELARLDDIGYGGQLNRLNRWLIRLAATRADALTVGSNTLAEIAGALLPGLRPRMLPFGVDVDLFRPRPETPPASGSATIRIIHVASLVPVKDQGTLVRAFARMRRSQRGLRLDVIGDGPLRSSLVRLSERLGISDAVTFRGAAAYDHIPALLRTADLFALSSRFEAQGMVLLEAAASGIPIVGTAVGVLPEIATGNQLAPTGDDHALAERIGSVLQPGADRAALARSALQATRDRFALARTAQQTLDLYCSLIRH